MNTQRAQLQMRNGTKEGEALQVVQAFTRSAFEGPLSGIALNGTDRDEMISPKCSESTISGRWTRC